MQLTWHGCHVEVFSGFNSSQQKHVSKTHGFGTCSKNTRSCMAAPFSCFSSSQIMTHVSPKIVIYLLLKNFEKHNYLCNKERKNIIKTKTGAPPEKKGRLEYYNQILLGNSPRRGLAQHHRRGRPSLRGEGTQQKGKQVCSTHMRDIEHTCHERDACERTCHANTRHYIYIHPDTGKQFICQTNHPINKTTRTRTMNKLNLRKV